MTYIFHQQRSSTRFRCSSSFSQIIIIEGLILLKSLHYCSLSRTLAIIRRENFIYSISHLFSSHFIKVLKQAVLECHLWLKRTVLADCTSPLIFISFGKVWWKLVPVKMLDLSGPPWIVMSFNQSMKRFTAYIVMCWSHCWPK